MRKTKSPKPRSTRYTKKQEQFFDLLESLENNVSEWIRTAVAEKMEREIAVWKNHKAEANQTVGGIMVNMLAYMGETDQTT